MPTLKEIEKYIKENAAKKNLDNVLNGLILYVENDPAAPENVKVLNRTLKSAFWLAVLNQNVESEKKNK